MLETLKVLGSQYMLLHFGTPVVLLELIAVSLEDFQHLNWMAAAILNTCSDGYIKPSTYFISS